MTISLPKILSAEYLLSAPSLEKAPPAEPGVPEIVMVGRSNVGKSSLINALVQRKNLAKTSNTPGKTRLMNFYRVRVQFEEEGPVQTFFFIDLPGYGYAKVSKTEQEQWGRELTRFLEKRESITQVIQLVDTRHAAKDADLHMWHWLQRQGRPSLLVLTKTDKMKQREVQDSRKAMAQAFEDIAENLVLFSTQSPATHTALWKLLRP